MPAGNSTSRRMVVSPQKAKEWLDTYNIDNYRTISEARVVQFARNMRAGNWHYTGHPICFDVNGVLQDGQHRLRAIIESDVDGLEFRVESGLPVDAKYFIDLGKPRNSKDVLSEKGYRYATCIAASVRLAEDVKTRRASNKTARGSQLTVPEIVKIVEADDLMQWAADTVQSMVPFAFMNRTVALYCFRVLYEIDKDDCMTFFSRLVNADGLDDNPQIKVLHRRFTLDNWNDVSGKELRLRIVTLMFRTWNAWRKNEHMAQAKISSNGKTYVIPEPV